MRTLDACGFAAFCGRPVRHRGHHGGWRTHVAHVAPNPVLRDWGGELGAELTVRELQVIAELVLHGGGKDVAACLGIAEQTVKNHVARVLAKTGAVSSRQLPYILGWLTLPDGTHHGASTIRVHDDGTTEDVA